MARSSEFERMVDRYVGIPLVFLISLARQRRALPPSPRRIGVIQPTSIGDMVLISGLLLHLSDRYPQAEIHVFHGPSNAGALALLPVDVIGHRCMFKKPWHALGELRRAEMDVLINCAPWSRLTALLTALSGAKATIGFRSAKQFAHLAYDVAVQYSSERHETENHLALARQFGPISEYRLGVRLREPPQHVDLPLERLVLMHVSAGGSRARQKGWPVGHWVALAQRLVEHGWVVGFTGVAGDAAIIQQIVGAARLRPDQCRCLAGQLKLPQLAHLLARAKLLITIDTGIAHLAGALGGSLVGLHGPTRYERWGARNAVSTGLNAPHPAAGYIHFGFEQHPLGDDVMATLTVDTVYSAVMARLLGTATDGRMVGLAPEPAFEEPVGTMGWPDFSAG